MCLPNFRWELSDIEQELLCVVWYGLYTDSKFGLYEFSIIVAT